MLLNTVQEFFLFSNVCDCTSVLISDTLFMVFIKKVTKTRSKEVTRNIFFYEA